MNFASKILSWDEAVLERKRLKRAGNTVVFSNGCYDMLHIGHVASLFHASRFGDKLFVGVNSDQSVKLNKGEKRPIIPERERALMLAALEAIDYVVIFEDKDVLPLIEALLPDVLVKGADRADLVVGQEVVEAHGGRVELAQTVEGFSTTNLIDRVMDNA